MSNPPPPSNAADNSQIVQSIVVLESVHNLNDCSAIMCPGNYQQPLYNGHF